MNEAFRSRRRRLPLMAMALAAALMTCFGLMPTHQAGAATPYPVIKINGPRFTTTGGANPLPTDRTVPHWHGSFTDGANNNPYGFNMVGSDPSTNGATTVNTEVIPLNFVFQGSGNSELYGTGASNVVEQSPMFANTPLPSGENTQYLDGVMRSEFNKIGTGYHTTLNNTATLPAQTIVVPAQYGGVYQVQSGQILGVIDQTWYQNALTNVMQPLQLDPTTLPIFISYDTYLDNGGLANCCVLGFHGAGSPNSGGPTHGNGNQPVRTFVWASWMPTGLFPPGMNDVTGLSHEVSEWGHDPFVDNYVNPWALPGEQQYGCTNTLETGDPLVGTNFAAGTTNPDPQTGPAWHLQDEANLWWFERQPTQASNHAYSYLGTLTSPAPTC